jgi:hypothetical protein
MSEAKSGITARYYGATRGTFAATFFLAALVAIGAEVVKLEDI